MPRTLLNQGRDLSLCFIEVQSKRKTGLCEIKSLFISEII